MAHKLGLGSVINGSFVKGSMPIHSYNPCRNYELAFSTSTEESHVNQAVNSAKEALALWSELSLEKRKHYLEKLKKVFIEHENAMAQIISLEMGKIFSEALTEAKSLSARIDLILNHGLKRVAGEKLSDLRAQTRYHHQGALAVIGPYNFPAHLINAHVIPSLALGNTVVIKPSEITPGVGELYAQCFLKAGFPHGVVNMVQGGREISQSLCQHNQLDGVLFTGSYQTGRILQEMLLDQPHKILALELGGKNFAVVMPDAHLEQAALEIIQGAFLTTGQRCTATSRVLIHEDIFAPLSKAIVKLAKHIKPDPINNQGFFGPLATKNALDKFLLGLKNAKEEGAQVLLESETLEGGAFVTPSVYSVDKNHPVKAYLGQELFGPNLALENFSTLDRAISRVNESPYGLSNSIFTLNESYVEKFYQACKNGILNINRSTNGALGQMPFGGVNKSGNQRPAGIDAVRYASFPVAITSLPFGESQAPEELKKIAKDEKLVKTSLATIRLRHDLEKVFASYGIYCEKAFNHWLIFKLASFNQELLGQKEFIFDLEKLFNTALEIDENFIILDLSKIIKPEKTVIDTKNYLSTWAQNFGLSLKAHIKQGINIPLGLELPKSSMMLDRIYLDNFVPKEKKPLVADLKQSRGPYLVSIDDDPLSLFDAASQIATIGTGFNADIWQNAYDLGDFDENLAGNYDLSLRPDSSKTANDAQKAQEDLEKTLHDLSEHKFKSISYGASGAEANEMAFDLCRQNGPGGTRIIAFEGAFHGRTIMALQATYNKEKRGPFVFDGFEASFVPFPAMENFNQDQSFDHNFLKTLFEGKIPQNLSGDELLAKELESLSSLKTEIEKGNVCAVIIEPMQCEGGDRYASNRFFNGLRALTRGLKVPLIFDEVQTGFHLGRRFFWHQQFDLRNHLGQSDSPDCMTLGKKAQLGICMSVWQNERTYHPHIVQLKRGLLHAKAMDSYKALSFEKLSMRELIRLKKYFPKLVFNIRASGFAFAFDLPNGVMANEIVSQRFHRGFMVYIAGEKTLRFRLNQACDEESVLELFEKLFIALSDMKDGNSFLRTKHELKIPEPQKTEITDVKIIELNYESFVSYVAEIEKIEKNTYEAGRKDSMETLHNWLKHKDSLGLLLLCKLNGQEIVGGYAIGGPLEHSHVDGPLDDPNRNKNNSFYSANITLCQSVRGHGLGTKLKHAQLAKLSKMKNADNNPRYYFLTGRNRLGFATAMTKINQHLGAYTVKIYQHQYKDEDAEAIYYRIPLRPQIKPEKISSENALVDCQSFVQNPFLKAPKTLLSDIAEGHFREIVGSKLTLSNWTTPNVVRYAELLKSLMPQGLNHAYFTSGRDEVVDKGLRSLRYHRLKADLVLGFSHQWLGNISAAARSLSHDENQKQPFAWFSWPKVQHPGLVGDETSLKQISQVLTQYPAEKFLGVVVELLGEKSGFCFTESFLEKLQEILKRHDIPLIYVETASGFGRSGETLWLSDSLATKPNMVWTYMGGQLGHVLVDDKYFVEKPLTLISTWDGDELSISRSYHNLCHAYDLDKSHIKTFSQKMNQLPKEFHQGQGCIHAIKLCEKTKNLWQKLSEEHGLAFSLGFDDWLMICPKADSSLSQFEKVFSFVNKLKTLSN